MHVDRVPNLYKSVDAFVLPSKGEGWGRPQVEAMSMELPTIATYWSGPTEFMTYDNSYPLNYSRLEPVDDSAGPGTKGHKWVLPSKFHLRKLMRHLVDNPEEGRMKGKQARQDLINNYSVERVSQIVNDAVSKAVSNFVVSRPTVQEPEPPKESQKDSQNQLPGSP